MRSDQQLNPRFVTSQNWTHDRGPGGKMKNSIRNEGNEAKPWTSFSHSGKERNRVFLNLEGTRFSDVSSISGADSILDGRSFVYWDFNRDGLLDLAVVNANKPLLQIFENQTSEKNNYIAIRLEGGSRAATATEEASNRDAIGAVVTLQVGDRKIMRVLSAGEGFASQNSRTLIIGLGSNTAVESAIIDWPSGRTTEITNLEAGTLVSAAEMQIYAKKGLYQLD